MGTWTAILTATGSVLAIWSISWIIRAQRTGSDDRRLEDDARARVASGQGWDGASAPRAFSDAQMQALSLSQQPLSLEQAGVIARPRPPRQRRGLASRRAERR